MKKQFYFLLSLVALFAVACESEPTEVSGDDGSLAVSFSAAITSRATDTAFESGDEISVTAYEADGSVFAQNASYTYSGSSFSSSSPIEYEDAEQELSFLAVYPYVDVPESKTINFEVKGDQSSGSNYTLSDLMLSYCGSTSSTTPQLTFNHMLTKVVISITSSDVSMLDAVATLNAMTSVECNLSTLSMTASGSASTITMASDGVLSYKAIVAPQTISSDSPLGAITADGNTYSFYYTSNVTMAAGKEYTFPATIFNGEIIFEEPLINDWDKGEVTADGLYLADFSETSYPTDSDTWVILDTTAETDDFAGLQAALIAVAVEDETRAISLEFLYLEKFPLEALSMSYDDIYANQSLCSVSAPNATLVGAYAFYCCSSLKSVSLPNVEGFGGSAFEYCLSLEDINVDENDNYVFEDGALYNKEKTMLIFVSHFVEEYSAPTTLTRMYDNYIFSYHTSLKIVYMPGVTTLGAYTFDDCTSLESVSLPEATTFGGCTFSGCTSLESVYLPAATTFGMYTFRNCTSLESVSLPEATTFEYYTFRNCTSLESVSLPKATTFGYSTFSDCTSLESVSLPEVTTLGSYTFHSCTALESVSLPEATTFGNYTFSSCTSLTDISIATNSGVVIDAFGSSAFNSANNLSNITLTIGSANSSMVNGLYFNAPDGEGGTNTYGEFKEILVAGDVVTIDGLYLADFSETSYPTDSDTWVILDTTATTDDFAGLQAALVAVAAEDESREISLEFSNLEEFPASALNMYSYIDAHQVLTSVSAPKATTFGNNTFCYCTSLASVSLPEATTFEGGTFCGCASLESISLPVATTLSDAAFYDCTSLVSVSLPAATIFGDFTFSGCTSLESVSLPEATTFGTYTFRYCTSITDISIATNSGVTIDAFGYVAFSSANDLSNITLTIGSANSSMVNGLYFTAPNGYSYGEFKAINVI